MSVFLITFLDKTVIRRHNLDPWEGEKKRQLSAKKYQNKYVFNSNYYYCFFVFNLDILLRSDFIFLFFLWGHSLNMNVNSITLRC